MKKLIRESLSAAAQGVGGTILVVGIASLFLADRFWIADLLVNFQVHYLVCLLACLFTLVLLGRQLIAAAFLMGTLFLSLPVIPYVKLPFREANTRQPQGNERVYRALCYNVLQSNVRTQDVADYIATQRVDFLLLLETDKHWSEEMEFELRDHFPHRFTKPRPDLQGLTFYSKLPWKSIRLIPELEEPTIEVNYELAEGTLTLLGIHPLPPMNPSLAERRNAFLGELAEYAAGLSGSVLVMGDFNVTPWSPHFQNIVQEGDLRDTAIGRGVQNTWYKFPVLFLGLPIDHMLTRDVDVLHREIGPPMSSDHRPVFLEFLLPNGE